MKRHIIAYLLVPLVALTSCSYEEQEVDVLKEVSSVPIVESASVFPANHPINFPAVAENPEAIKIESLIDKMGKFVQNKGQLQLLRGIAEPRIGDITHYSRIGAGTVYFGTKGVSYGFIKTSFENSAQVRLRCDEMRKDQSIAYMVNFVGAKEVIPEGEKAEPTLMNYFVGNEEDKWVRRARVFQSIEYQHLYPGIDLSYYESNNTLKYDFIVSESGDVQDIELGFSGIQQVEISTEGHLLLTMDWGVLQDDKPYTYQMINGEKVEVASKYVKKGRRSIGFEILESYDKRYPLVIDPATASWVSYLTSGGAADTGYLTDIVIDDDGATYGVGWVNQSMPSTDTIGTFSFTGPDVAVYKLSSDGTTLEFATIITGSNGGGGSDVAMGVDINSSKELYVCGFTQSSDFPTKNAHDATYSLSYDMFLLNMSSDGDTLQYSTFIGGTGTDGAFEIVEHSDTVYITGYTQSSGLHTAGVYDNAYHGSTYDSFLAKFNPDGTQAFFTYYGDAGDDMCKGLDLDSDGNPIICGYTSSGSNMTSAGAYQTAHGGNVDVFVAKFNKIGTLRTWATYVGGLGGDYAGRMKVNERDEVIFIGHADHSTYPNKFAHQAAPVSGSDAILTGVGADGDSLIFSTWIAGGGADNGTKGRTFTDSQYWSPGGIDITSEVAVIVFETASIDMAIKDALSYSTSNTNDGDGNFDGSSVTGSYDAYIALYKYDSVYTGTNLSLKFATYFGGAGTDYPTGGVALSPKATSSDPCFVVGTNAHSNDFPTTAGTYEDQSTTGNDQWTFAKICDNVVLPVDLISFEGQRQENGQILLSWATIQEKDHDHFEVLRSEDGMHFSPIAIVGKGSMGARKGYSFTDKVGEDFDGYYQLRQVDHDGDYAMSEVIHVGKMYEVPRLEVVGDEISFKGNFDRSQTIYFTVSNSTGQVVEAQSFEVEAGIHASTIDLSLEPHQVYMVQASGLGFRIHRKIIIGD